jgi:hypothetical protein
MRNHTVWHTNSNQRFGRRSDDGGVWEFCVLNEKNVLVVDCALRNGRENMKLGKNIKKALGLGFFTLIAAFLILLPVGAKNGGFLDGNIDTVDGGSCAGAFGCHDTFDGTQVSISMSFNPTSPFTPGQTNIQVTVTVNMNGANGGSETGVSLRVGPTGANSRLGIENDGWVITNDPNSGTNNFIQQPGLVGAGPTNLVWTVTAPTTPGTYYVEPTVWYDNGGAGREYNLAPEQTITVTAVANNPPEAQGLTVEGFAGGTPGILHINPPLPTLGWTFTDPDGGDVQTQYDIRVGTGSGLSDMWAPGPQAGAASSDVYGGSPLMENTDYWFGVRVHDGTEWSLWNETQFHMNSVETRDITVQSFASGTPGILHITDHFPYLNWTFWDGEADSQTQYEIRVGTAMSLSDMWAPGMQPGAATSEIYAGALLMDGTDYWYGVRAYDGWIWSEFNDTMFHMNSVDAINPTVSGFLGGSGGIMHITDHTPDLGWTFSDGEGDLQLQYEIKVGSGPGLSDMWNPGAQVSGASSDIYAGLPLVDFTDYWFGIRVFDGYEWSAWTEVQFHLNNLSEAIDLTVDGYTPGSPDILHIISSNPTLGWTFFDFEGGDVQTQYEIRVGTASGLSDMWNSGTLIGPFNSETYAGLPLQDRTDYWFSVRVYDGFEWSPWNETMFHTNGIPQSRDLTVQGYIFGSQGMAHITDHTPDLGWAFFDFEIGDTQQQYEIRAGTSSGLSDMWAPGAQPGAVSSEVYAGSILLDGTDYYFGIRVFDGYEWSNWNETLFHMNSLPPAPIPPINPPDDSNIPSSPAQTVSWTGGADPEGDTITYWWYVDVDLIPTPPYTANGSTTGTSSASFATSPATDYYWYVNATDGWEWNSTIVWNFTTSAVVNNPPEAMGPMVQGFVDGSMGIMHITDHTPLLEWFFTDPDLADVQVRYQVRVGTAPGISNKWNPPDLPGAGNSEIYGGSVLQDGVDYWYAARVFDGNTWSNWNETQFHMNSVDVWGLKVSGFNTGSNQIMHIIDHTPDLAWTFIDGEADSQQQYEIRVGTQSGFSDMWNPGAMGGPASSEVYAGSALLDGTDYYFGIRVNDGYEWSGWNETLFHMNALPPAPIPPLSPPDDANIPSSPAQTISWTAGGADPEGDTITYWWYVDIDMVPTPPYTAEGNTIGTSSSSFSTSPGTDYYWYVNATDGWEWNSTIIWNFTTSAVVNNPPEAIDLAVSGFAPGTPEILHILDHTPDLSWSFFDLDGGDTQQQYQVRVGTASGLSDMWSPGTQMGAGNLETYSGSILIDGVDYWFGIRVFDGSTWSIWNETLFHMNALPSLPTPLNPPDDANISSSPGQTLSWNPGGSDSENDTITYYWYVDTVNPPAFPYLANGTTNGTSSTPFATAPGTEYYWIINMTDGWEWTSTIVWNFTTSGSVNIPPEVWDLLVSGFADGTPGILHITDATPDLGWSFFDLDLGDTQIQFEVRVGTAPGLSDMWNPGPVVGAGNSIVYAGASLIDGNDYWFGVLVYDGIDWSLVNETMFHMNMQPSSQDLTVSGFTLGTPEILHLLDHTPDLGWGFLDVDGDTQSEYEVRVGTSSGFSDMWAPGAQAGAGNSIVYGGSALIDGTDYYFGIRVFDGYEWSFWNETMFNMNTPPPAPVAPVDPLDDSNITENSAQTISWTSGGVDSDGDSVTYYWYVDTDILLLPPYLANNVTTGLSSTTFITISSSQYYWFVNVTDGWEWSTSMVWNFSTKDPVNQFPVASGLTVEGFLGGSQDILHLIEHAPELAWSFLDTDLGDTQTRYEVRIGSSSGTSDMWSPGPTDGSATTVTYAGSSLIDGEDYFFAVRVFDGKNWSAWSEVTFHMNIPPEVTELTVDGSSEGTSEIMTIPSATPTFNGDYLDPDGVFTLQKYELKIGSASGLSDLWEPGVMDGALSEIVYNGSTLDRGINYWFSLRIFDGYEWSQWQETQFKLNQIPELDWTSIAGFESDGVNPESGNLSTTFVFKIKYSDPEGHPPTEGPKLHILKWGMEISQSPFTMIYESGSDLTGAIYTYSITMAEGVNYTYYFSASDILGQSAQPTEEMDGPTVIDDTPIPPPSPPTDFTVKVPDDQGELRLSWERGEGDVAGYNIYRSTTASGFGIDFSKFELIATVNEFTTTYSDTNLKDETSYYYLIRAFNSEGLESDYTDDAWGRTIAEPQEKVEPEDNFLLILLIIIVIIVIILVLIMASKRRKREEEEPISSEEIFSGSEEGEIPSEDVEKTKEIEEESSETIEEGAQVSSDVEPSESVDKEPSSPADLEPEIKESKPPSQE